MHVHVCGNIAIGGGEVANPVTSALLNCRVKNSLPGRTDSVRWSSSRMTTSLCAANSEDPEQLFLLWSVPTYLDSEPRRPRRGNDENDDGVDDMTPVDTPENK